MSDARPAPGSIACDVTPGVLLRVQFDVTDSDESFGTDFIAAFIAAFKLSSFKSALSLTGSLFFIPLGNSSLERFDNQSGS